MVTPPPPHIVFNVVQVGFSFVMCVTFSKATVVEQSEDGDGAEEKSQI